MVLEANSVQVPEIFPRCGSATGAIVPIHCASNPVGPARSSEGPHTNNARRAAPSGRIPHADGVFRAGSNRHSVGCFSSRIRTNRLSAPIHLSERTTAQLEPSHPQRSATRLNQSDRLDKPCRNCHLQADNAVPTKPVKCSTTAQVATLEKTWDALPRPTSPRLRVSLVLPPRVVKFRFLRQATGRFRAALRLAGSVLYNGWRASS